MTCILPIMLLLNSMGMVVAHSWRYKTPNPHVETANSECKALFNACPSMIFINANGTWTVTCAKPQPRTPNVESN